MIEVADIFSEHIDQYRLTHKLSLQQHKAVNAILSCRTAALGGHVDTCPSCGTIAISYNSCRNRHCPKCQTLAKERWIDKQKTDLLNVQYFHIVFTLPQELHQTVYANQIDLYRLMFHCAAKTLSELACDQKYLGAGIGITTVLHTWGQNLHYHPHIHCIVPGGGLNQNGFWVNSKKKFFIPVKVLSRKFRGKFLAELKRILPDTPKQLLSVCYEKEWVAYCKPPFRTSAHVVEYLGRYTHRVAISNNRILSFKDGMVTFRWRDYKDNNTMKKITLSATEFMRRFLMHILPKGFMKIRHYGFLSSRGKQLNLALCKRLTHTPIFDRIATDTIMLITKLLGRNPFVCTRCGFERLIRIEFPP